MNNSYKIKEKLGFFKRMWNEFFHKTKMIEAPIEYTQKEVKMKSDKIINYLSSRT